MVLKYSAFPVILMSGTAWADPAEPSSETVADLRAWHPERFPAIGEDGTIIVTGTLVRGTGPVGNDVLVLPRERIEETGAATTAELLQSIPQLPSFNSLQFPLARCNCQTVNRPNLRGLTPLGVTGSSTTLVMVDGHRIVGMGVLSTTPDPDIIPPPMIERLEIVLDGGSAIYGSDAVSGVMNFVTRRTLEGLEAQAHYGVADNYHTFDANIAAGTDWEGGSAFFSYSYVEHDAIFGRDRDFVRRFPSNVPGVPFPVRNLRCSPGNVQLLPAGTVFALPYTSGTAVAGTVNQCDESDDATIYPRGQLHSFFGGVAQELGDGIKLDVRGYYFDRDEWQTLGHSIPVVTLGPPFIRGIPTGLPFDSPYRQRHLVSGNPFEVHQISLAFGDAQSTRVTAELTSWGITPSVTVDIGKGWELRGFLNYGESRTEGHTRHFNPTAFGASIVAGLFNPYDPPSSDPRAMEIVQAFEDFGLTRQKMYNARAVADGDVAHIAGGAVKLALGVEFLRESVSVQVGPTVPGSQNTGYPSIVLPASLPGAPAVLVRPEGAPLPTNKLHRDNISAFGDLVVPLVGRENSRPGLRELTLSAAARYDNYSDFGGTFNPKFGISYRPTDWIKLRGAWGTSFVAPSLVDLDEAVVTQLGFATNFAQLFPPPSLIASGMWPAPRPGQNTVAVLVGSQPDLKPQEATSLSVGADIDPPFVPGLNLGVTYWKTDYDKGIGVPPVRGDRNLFWSHFQSSIITNPTQAQVGAALAVSDTIAGFPCSPLPGCLYAILDERRTNLLKWKLDGLDFTARYSRPTSFGIVDLAVDGSYTFHFKVQPSVGVPFFDIVEANASQFRLRATLGADVGNWRVSATLNHTAGYKLDPPAGLAPQQTRVGSFNVVDLFAKYEFPDQGEIGRLTFYVNIDNLFDEDPPEYREPSPDPTANGYANGSTLGRLIRLGASIQF